MKKQLSPAFIKKVKGLLPNLRNETKKELTRWGDYIPGPEFYADDKVTETLPFAAYEYLSVWRNIKLERGLVIDWLNDGTFDTVLEKVICHALRRLALKKGASHKPNKSVHAYKV